MTDQRQVSRGRLTATGRVAYELEARTLALEVLRIASTPHVAMFAQAVALARVVLRLTDGESGR